MISILVLIILSALWLSLVEWRQVARSRKYKSGTGWCFWRWSDVESEYILRLHVLKTPWWAICLHWINKPDKEPWLHDHPVSFLSLILRGGYAERRRSCNGYGRTYSDKIEVRGRFNFIRANPGDQHTIIFARRNTLTLALMGPKTREWGFHVPGGWIMWKKYYALLKEGHAVRSEAFWKSEEGKRHIIWFIDRGEFYKKVSFG